MSNVSIHAPTRGATQLLIQGQVKGYLFQFTHPRGVRQQMKYSTNRYRMFQFTHPRGVRQSYRVWLGLDKAVSIHAPTRGATNNADDEDAVY